jgi:hypothetical protein
MNCRLCLLCLLFFFRRHGGIQFLYLTNLAARQHHRRALFNSGRVIEINLVGHQRPEQSRCAEQDQKKGDHCDRADHEQAGQNFISL